MALLQISTPEDGRDHHPKHVELIGIINKPFLLHLVGVYIIYVNDARPNKYIIWKINVYQNKSRNIPHNSMLVLFRFNTLAVPFS